MSDSAATYAQAFVDQAIAFAGQGRLEDAATALGQALQWQPENVEAYYLLGNIHFLQGSYNEATACYEQVVRLNPQHARGHYNLGVALHQQSRLVEAADSYEHAVQVDPVCLDAWNNLGAVRLGLRDLDGAVACYREVLRLRPDHAMAHINLGNALAEQGHFDAAAASYRQAIALQPDYAEAYNNLANLLSAQGRLEEGVAYCREAIRLKPAYARAHTNLGNLLAQQSRFDEATACHLEALRLNPASPEAYNNLGLVLAQQGRREDAAASFRQAIQLQPELPQTRINLANVLADLGRFDEAAVCYQEILRLRPDLAVAHHNLGNVFTNLGRYDEAIACYRQAIHLDPTLADSYTNLGLAFVRQDRLDDAADSYEKALHLQPGSADAHTGRGAVWALQGRLAEAIASHQRALELNPHHPDAHNNLGMTLAMQGKLDEAKSHYEQALAIDPDFSDALNSLGLVLRQQGHLHEAARRFEQALHLRPNLADTHYNLALVLADLNQTDDAVASLRQALVAKPDFGRAHAFLGELLKEQGKMKEALASLVQALCREPDAKLKILDALVLPPIYDTIEDVPRWRERLTHKVRDLRDAKVQLDVTEDSAKYPFYLVYQGKNDRELQQAIAGLYSPPAFTLPSRQQATGKIKVGFLSRNLRNHTIGRLNRGIIAGLNRELFTVTVLSVGHYRDEIATFLRSHADHYFDVPMHLQAARQLIAEQQLDVLFYTDIGLDPVTYSLAFSRLAPVQCVTWGHPVTTGIPTIDYFISSDLLEGDGAEDHYTEKLVRLKNLAVYYVRPPAASVKNRAALGLPEGRTLYGCPQTLFKFHPEFDAILAGILRRDPNGVLYLITGKYQHWDVLLRERFSRTLPDVLDRILFLGNQNYEDFLNVLARTDVLLDPIHFGGGNTSYEGLAAGVPIVTLPSPFLRGRITLALYQQMNVMDTVVRTPEAYVDLAVKLGTDAGYRASLRDKILANHDVLYENAAGIRDLEQFFIQAVQSPPAR